MRNKIWEYLNKKKKDFDLEGVEISEDDIDLIESRINELNMSLEQLCDIVLESIRDCLDEELNDNEEF